MIKRVIFDTNLWISFLISKKLSFLDSYIENGDINLVFSEELMGEFIDVAFRPKFQKYFSKSDIEELLSLFDSYGEMVNVTSKVELCRDNKDNFLLDLAIDSNADFLVTGDSDLLVIKKINNTEIITLEQLISKI